MHEEITSGHTMPEVISLLCERRWEAVLHRGVWLFAVGAMAGFLLESLESAVSLGYVQNRQGMLYGPFSPIYGVGAVLFALAAPLLRGRPRWAMFLVTAALATGAEYLCALAQERAFGVRFWDYSHLGLSLSGRVTLLFTLWWGALGVAFIRWVWPAFEGLIDGLRRPGKRLLTAALLALFLFDAGLSAAALTRQEQRRHDLPAATAFGAFLDERYPDQRLEEMFPTMRELEQKTD